MQFLALASSADTVLPDPGLTNLGQQNIGQFYDHLAKSQVLVSRRGGLTMADGVQPLTSLNLFLCQIGLGRPFLSPTPYDALCR